MQMDNNRIPRWLVESDPSWEESVDSDIMMRKWTKKGTKIQAVCHPNSMFCDIVGRGDHVNDVSSLLGNVRLNKQPSAVAGLDDVTKYLSSRYLNPNMNGMPKFDAKKFLKW
jgi:hypothetical protein